MALFERGDELAVATSRRASAVSKLAIFPASLAAGAIRIRPKIADSVMFRRPCVRSMIWVIIFIPFLENDGEFGPTASPAAKCVSE